MNKTMTQENDDVNLLYVDACLIGEYINGRMSLDIFIGEYNNNQKNKSYYFDRKEMVKEYDAYGNPFPCKHIFDRETGNRIG